MFCEEFAKILLDNRKVANVFSSYFQSILETLTYLNDQTSRNLTFLMKLTELLRNIGLKPALLN